MATNTSLYETQYASDVHVTGVDASQIADPIDSTTSAITISCSRGLVNPTLVNTDWLIRVYGQQADTVYCNYDNSLENAIHALDVNNNAYVTRVVAEDARYPTAILDTTGFTDATGVTHIIGSTADKGLLSPKSSLADMIDQINTTKPLTKDVIFYNVGPGLNEDISIEIESSNFDPNEGNVINTAITTLFGTDVNSFNLTTTNNKMFYLLTAITDKGEIPIDLPDTAFSALNLDGTIDTTSATTPSVPTSQLPIMSKMLAVELPSDGTHKVVMQVKLPSMYRFANSIRLYRCIVDSTSLTDATSSVEQYLQGATVTSNGKPVTFTLLREQNPYNFVDTTVIEDKGTIGQQVAMPAWFGYATAAYNVQYNAIVSGNDVYTLNVYDMQYSGGTTPVEVYQVAFYDKTASNGDSLEIAKVINASSVVIRCKNLVNMPIANLPYIPRTTLTGGSEGSNVDRTGVKPQVKHTTQDYLNALMRFANYDKYPVGFILDFANCQDPSYYMLISQLATFLKSHTMYSVPNNQQLAGSFEQFAKSLPRNAYSSVYGPWLVGVNTVMGGSTSYAPAAWAYRLACASDKANANNGRSFAGLNRGVTSAIGFESEDYEYDERERDNLKNANANYFMDKSGVGIHLREQRTLNGVNSHASWVNVSRIWVTLQRYCKARWEYSLQEPNDEFLVKQIMLDAQQVAQTYLDSRDLNTVIIYADERAGNNAETLARAIRNIDVIIEANLAVDRIQGRIILSKNAVEFASLSGVTTQDI